METTATTSEVMHPASTTTTPTMPSPPFAPTHRAPSSCAKGIPAQQRRTAFGPQREPTVVSIATVRKKRPSSAIPSSASPIHGVWLLMTMDRTSSFTPRGQVFRGCFRHGQGPLRSQHEGPSILKSNQVRPTSGVEFVSSRHFPDEVQGDALINNNIGFLGIKQHQMIDEDPASRLNTAKTCSYPKT